jgi:hypothetical protein
LLVSGFAIAQATAPASPAAAPAPAVPSANAPAAAPAGTAPAAAPAKARPPGRATAAPGSTSVTTVPGGNAGKAQKNAKGEKRAAPRGTGTAAATTDGAKPATGAVASEGTRGDTQRRQLQGLYAGVMTDDEESAYRKKVRDVKTYDQCKSLLEATHKAMEPRATAQGKPLAQSPTEACDQAKERGRVKG